MAESIETNCTGKKVWKWYSVASDLETQGGLQDVLIYPLSVTDCGCAGVLGTNPFYITWIHEKFLLLTMKEYSQPLVDAFAKVLEYLPFCRYDGVHGITVEWDKVDPASRIVELQHEVEVMGLVLLSE